MGLLIMSGSRGWSAKVAQRERLRGNRWFVAVGVVGLLLLGFALVAPAVIKSASGPTTTWAELADIGSAYGGVAAVASTFALLGVCLSLLLQHRQARLQQIFTVRQRHFELLKLSLEQPELMKIFGPQVTATTAYFNMFLAIGARCGNWGKSQRL